MIISMLGYHTCIDGVRSPKFIWAPVHSCTHWLRPLNSPPSPAFGLIRGRALLVSQDRRHLFVTPCVPYMYGGIWLSVWQRSNQKHFSFYQTLTSKKRCKVYYSPYFEMCKIVLIFFLIFQACTFLYGGMRVGSYFRSLIPDNCYVILSANENVIIKKVQDSNPKPDIPVSLCLSTVMKKTQRLSISQSIPSEEHKYVIKKYYVHISDYL